MNCERARKILVDYSENALGAGKMRAVEEHLSGCGACRTELSQIKRVKERILLLDTPERDDEFWQRFGSRLSQKLEGEEAPAPDRRLLWRAGLPLATAAGIALVIGLLIFHVTDRPPSTVQKVAYEMVSMEATEASEPGYDIFDGETFGESLLAMADYSNEDIEEVADEMFLLIEEDLQAASEEMVLYDIYEQTIDDFLEDLSPEELDELYEGLASI